MLQTAIFFLLFAFSSSFAQEINVTVTMDDPSVLHKGNWSDGVVTEKIGSSLSYSFNGTAFYMFMPKASSYGEGVIVFDGTSYPWNGFTNNDDLDDVCGLCVADLDPDKEHNVNVTFTSHGESDDPFGAALVVSYMIYTVNETATPPNTFTDPGTSTSNSPNSPSSEDGSGSLPSSSTPASSSSSSSNLPVIIGASAGGVALLLACGAAFYFYRRGRRLSSETTRPPWERDNFAPMPDTGDRGYMGYRERVPPPASYPAPTPSLPPSGSDGSGPAGTPSSTSHSAHSEQYHHMNGQSTGSWVATQQQQPLLSEKQRLMMAANSPYNNSPSPSAFNSSSTQQLLPPPPAQSTAPLSEKQRLAMAADSPYNNSRPPFAYPSNTSSSHALNPPLNPPRVLTSAPGSEKRQRMRTAETSPAYPTSTQVQAPSQGGGADVDHLRAQVERLAGLLEARDTPPGYN